MQELKLLSEAELKNLQASKQKLLDPLSNHALCSLTLCLVVVSEVYFWWFGVKASFSNSHW